MDELREEWLDIRVRDRYLLKERISPADVERYLAQLVDQSCEFIDYETRFRSEADKKDDPNAIDTQPPPPLAPAAGTEGLGVGGGGGYNPPPNSGHGGGGYGSGTSY